MPGSAEGAGVQDPAARRQHADSLERIDRALIGLRHLWSAPPRVDYPALGSVDMSTIWIVDALTRAEESIESSSGPAHGSGGSGCGRVDAGSGGRSAMTIGDLALALDVAHSTASRLVDRAHASSAISRSPAATDARRVTVRLTDVGRELASTSRAFRSRHLDRATASWTDHERVTFAELLSRFAEAVGNLGPIPDRASRARPPAPPPDPLVPQPPTETERRIP